MKIAIVLSFLALFSGFAAAGVEMTFPQKASLSEGSSIQLGSVSPGQSFDLVFSDKSSSGFEWTSIEIVKSSLPAGWAVSAQQRTDTSILLTVTIPSGAPEGSAALKVRLSNPVQNAAETVTAIVGVKKNLVTVSFSRVSQDKQYPLGEKSKYSVSVSNLSIAKDTVTISANLPSSWFAAEVLTLRAKESDSFEVQVSPQTPGVRQFSFSALLGSNNSYISSFDTSVDVTPTLKGKLGSSLSGFPFFTFALSPFQLLDSVLSAFMK